MHSIKNEMLKIPSKKSITPPIKKIVSCAECGDIGWFRFNVPMSHSDFGKVFQCKCQVVISQERKEKRNRQYLLENDGLTPRERKLTFESLKYPSGNIELVLAAYKTMLACSKESGFLTFVGDSDASKSTFLMAAVNYSRNNNTLSVYVTMTNLLNQLKKGFSEDAKVDFAKRLHILTTTKVLCIDEVDKFNPTIWAKEQFDELINERWRHLDVCLTIVSCNSIAKLDRHIQSRMKDGRGKIINMKSTNFRNTLKE